MFRKLNIKTRYLIIISVLSLLASVAVALLYLYHVIDNQPLFLILMFIAIFTFTSSTSAMINRLVSKQLDKKRRGKKFSFDMKIDESIFDRVEDHNYGKWYIKFVNKTAYALTVVNDSQIFFSEEASKQDLKNNKISKSIQFYIFNLKDYSISNTQIKMLNYQAKKFFLQSFIYDENKNILQQVEEVKADNEFYDDVKRMYQFLGIDTN